jgi:DMSO/TMAO reductase YedYZ molybdopterin-dependent catalytic subunit
MLGFRLEVTKLDKPNSRKKTFVAIGIILVFLVALIGIYLESKNTPIQPAEIRQYQGQNLSSIESVYQNAIKGLQYINQTTYRLAVTGLVGRTLQLSYNDIVSNQQSYKQVVTINCGWNATLLWEGILVKDLIQEAGFSKEATVVIFHASDGFTTSLPLDYIIQDNIMVAFKMNGVTLTPQTGWPLMLIVPHQYGYKWIKWITEIEVSNDTNYQGYWESRGFPNNATVVP